MSLTQQARSCPHPVNLHLEFLRRTSVGPAIFTVKDVKLGSRISNLHITLSQKRDAANDKGPNQEEVEGYLTLSNISTETGLTLDTQYQLWPQRLPADLPRLGSQHKDENYMLRASDPFPSFRRAAQNLQIHLVRPDNKIAPNAASGRPRAMIDQWVRFTPKPARFKGAPGRWTNDALGFLVDMFPQIVEGYVNPFVEEAALGQHTQEEVKKFLSANEPRAKFWYPTLALNLDIKKLLPEEGVEWLFVRVKAKAIKNGRFDLDIEVWDEQGELVASSVHASLVMDASRNHTRSNGQLKEKKRESKL